MGPPSVVYDALRSVPQTKMDTSVANIAQVQYGYKLTYVNDVFIFKKTTPQLIDTFIYNTLQIYITNL